MNVLITQYLVLCHHCKSEVIFQKSECYSFLVHLQLRVLSFNGKNKIYSPELWVDSPARWKLVSRG